MVLAYVSAGAGHRQAARAIQAGLTQARPDVRVELLDVLDFTSRLFRLYYAGGFGLLVSRLGWLYGFGYWLTDLPSGTGRSFSELMRLVFERHSIRRLTRHLLNSRPVLVVNTHYLQAPPIGRVIAQGAKGLRQFVVMTDNEAHRWWYARNVECYFVPAEVCRQRLLEYGVPADTIELAGIPVHPKWSTTLDEARIRADWKLPADAPVVLVGGGVHFTVGRIDKLAADLAAAVPQAVVLVLAGGNKKLLAQIARLPAAQGDSPRLRGLSFTDRVDELVSVAALMVTKPGGMTTAECLAKGAAMVLLKPVPGQEAANARLLIQQGAAVGARTPQEVVQQVQRLLAAPADLARLRSNARRLARPGTDIIVRRILEAIDTWPTLP